MSWEFHLHERLNHPGFPDKSGGESRSKLPGLPRPDEGKNPNPGYS